MRPKAPPVTGSDNLLRAPDGTIPAEFVDTFSLAILEFPQASVIALRLYETSAADGPTAGVQVRLSAQSAQRLAHLLSDAAAALLGQGQPRQ